MKVVAVVQARMGSSRLPGKVFADIGGKPMLQRVLDRLARSRSLDEVRVATTTQPADDAIERWCHEHDWPVTRGSEEDVLDRYMQAARESQADVVVRITSDCPLIDPELVDSARMYFEMMRPLGVVYTTNVLEPRSYPRGLDVEVIDVRALETAWLEDTRPEWREHVTPYLYRNEERFPVSHVCDDNDNGHLRWTVDTPEDLELVRAIYAHFDNDDTFGYEEILDAYRANPEWHSFNAHVQQKPVAE